MSKEQQLDRNYQGNSTASVILGAVGYFFWVGMPIAAATLSGIAIALAVIALVKGQANKIAAIVGLVLNSASLVVGFVLLILNLFFKS